MIELKEPKAEEDEDPDTSAVETFNQYETSSLLLDIPLHGAYQTKQASLASSVSGLVRAGSPYSGGSTFQIPILSDYGSRLGPEYEEHKSHVRSPYFPYPEDCQNSYFGIMMSYVGSSPVEPLNSLPIEATRRNAELMHMCEYSMSTPKEGLLTGFSYRETFAVHVVD